VIASLWGAAWFPFVVFVVEMMMLLWAAYFLSLLVLLQLMDDDSTLRRDPLRSTTTRSTRCALPAEPTPSLTLKLWMT